METSRNSSNITEMAPIILAEIMKSQSVLLCRHTSPDPDSVGSALAMKFVIESLGKKATVIKGDSVLPLAFMHFPGADSIIQKNIGEIDFEDFDLFIAVDSGSPDQISRIKPVIFPLPIRSIVIDHHGSNIGYADVNLIVEGAPATSEVIYELLKLWHVEITPEIATNLFVAIYFDTQGLKTDSTRPNTYEVMSFLAGKVPNISTLISKVENSETPQILALYGMALSSIKTYLDDTIAISSVSYEGLVKCGVDEIRLSTSYISVLMKIVMKWKVLITIMEIAPGKIKCSLRTNDAEHFPVDKLAQAFGGGGHRAAAGIKLDVSIDEAQKLIVSKAKELYNL